MRMMNDLADDSAKFFDNQSSFYREGSGNDNINARVTGKNAEIIVPRFFQTFGTNLKVTSMQPSTRAS